MKKQEMERLTQEEIDKARSSWLDDTHSWLDLFIDKEVLQPYFKKLNDHRIIEIGPAKNPIRNFSQCKEYLGIEPNKKNVPDNSEDYIITDALSFLNNQHNNSAVIVSFGVVANNVLNSNIYNRDVAEAYIKEMADEIKRVFFPFSIIVADDTSSILGEPTQHIFNKGLSEQFPFGGVYIK